MGAKTFALNLKSTGTDDNALKYNFSFQKQLKFAVTLIYVNPLAEKETFSWAGSHYFVQNKSSLCCLFFLFPSKHDKTLFLCSTFFFFVFRLKEKYEKWTRSNIIYPLITIENIFSKDMFWNQYTLFNNRMKYC